MRPFGEVCMAEILVAITLIGNVFIVLLLLHRGWSGRLQWFTVTTALAVLVDCLFYFVHGAIHQMYGPLRVFVVYWMFPLLECVCAWEAALVGVRWLERLMCLQVALSAVTLFAHLHGDVFAVYRLEMFVVYVNLAGILFSIYKLRNEVDYARGDPSKWQHYRQQ